jgi:hypothetical protein
MLAAGYPKALIPCHVPNNIPSTSTWPVCTLTHIYMRGGDEREHIHIYRVIHHQSARHLESMLKGIKSYLCLVQTGHVDVEGILFGTWQGIRAFG